MSDSTPTLPFSLRDLRKAIPESCFRSSPIRSLSYLLADVLALVVLYAAALRFDAWILRPFFWLAIGTLFFSLYVIGHDCGHGSFSRHRWLNSLVGHLTNALVLVPYHSWRLSHRIHHANAGHVARDEGWYPPTESELREMPRWNRWIRLHAVPAVFPLYLLRRSYGRAGSHYHPASSLFDDADRSAVRLSLMVCGAMVLVLARVGAIGGPGLLVDLYLAPYAVFVVWIDVVTYLHHTDPKIPWYREPAWSFLRGALSTIDRDYGWLGRVHHSIGIHAVHHLFPRIPHYHLRRATRAARPLLGPHYRHSEEPILRAFLHSLAECRVVPDVGEVVYCTREPSLPASQSPRLEPSDEMIGLGPVRREEVVGPS
jgi:omega-3 fatty acid desaturase (delta-15 desaturase)